MHHAHHAHHAHEEDPQPTISGTKHGLSKACNHGRYWRICKDSECKSKVTAHDDTARAHRAEKAVAALREAEDRRLMPPPPARHPSHPHVPHYRDTHTHMTHLLGQLKILAGQIHFIAGDVADSAIR
jgi:hypothetical protein